MSTRITPVATAEEAVAIIAATEVLWPKPVVAAAAQNPLRVPTWRFSGRWWAKPLPARRDRPFR